MKIDHYVKMYCLGYGEIVISQVSHIEKKNKKIECFRGNNEIRYVGEEEFITIKPYTAVWDKRYSRWIFKLPRNEGFHGMVIVDYCEYLEPLLVSQEKVNYDFNNYVYMEE